MNNEITILVAFQEKHASHMIPVNDTIPATLLNAEEDIEEVNKDGADKGSEKEEWDDD